MCLAPKRNKSKKKIFEMFTVNTKSIRKILIHNWKGAFFFFKISTFQFVLLFLVMFLSGDETNQQFGIGDMFSFFRHFTIGGTGCQPSPSHNIMRTTHIVFDMTNPYQQYNISSIFSKILMDIHTGCFFSLGLPQKS